MYYGTEKHKEATRRGGLIAGHQIKEYWLNQRHMYLKNPNRCKNCNCDLDYEKRNNIFCSRSCSSIYNNFKRLPRTYESKLKTKQSCKLHRLNLGAYCKLNIKTCIFCNNIFFNPKRKTCSESCYHALLSKNASEKLRCISNRKNYGRHKKSYLELSFINWMKQNNIKHEYISEKQFYNDELKKNYYVDFFFPNLNLVIELDGTQHKNTVEKDKIRDEFLKRKFNLLIIRITYKEYQDKSKLKLIRSLLK